MNARDLRIAYFLRTDIQHIPPVARIYPYLGGTIITPSRRIHDHIVNNYAHLNADVVLVRSSWQARAIAFRKKIRMTVYTGFQDIKCGLAAIIFHGISDKRYEEHPHITRFDLVLLQGEKTRDKLARCGLLPHIANWEVVGYPKLDPLIRGEVRPARLFDNGRKTILYAPTWICTPDKMQVVKFTEHGESSLPLFGLPVIEALAPAHNLIVKFHSRAAREKGDIFDQMESLVAARGWGSTVKLVWDSDILPYMAASDLMITDISTVAYEWFALNRPTVFANPAPEHYRPSDDIASPTYVWQAGDVVNGPGEILPVVTRALATDPHAAARRRMLEYAMHRPDGHAAEREVDVIRQFYHRFDHLPFWALWILHLQRHLRFQIHLRRSRPGNGEAG